MKKIVKNRKVCSRGHVFFKSSDCPVCPKCWSGYYRKKNGGDFPDGLASPALRSLLNADIMSLSQLAKRAETEIAELHGMGPKALGQLRAALRKRGLSFAKGKK